MTQQADSNYDQYINALKAGGYTVFKPKRTKNDPSIKESKAKARETRKAITAILKQRYASKAVAQGLAPPKLKRTQSVALKAVRLPKAKTNSAPVQSYPVAK